MTLFWCWQEPGQPQPGVGTLGPGADPRHRGAAARARAHSQGHRGQRGPRGHGGLRGRGYPGRWLAR